MAAVRDFKLLTARRNQSDGSGSGNELEETPVKPSAAPEELITSPLGTSAPTLLAYPPSQKRLGRRGTTTSPLGIGRELGPYMLLESLGRGAQGDVWKAARLVAAGELVALKILKPGLKSNAARMAQFRREAERGIRLCGPSLLKVYELGESDGYIYMTMPYVEGTPLSDIVSCRRNYLAGDDVEVNHAFAGIKSEDYQSGMMRVLAKVARALSRVHDQCIAHRDIKPANILLDNRHIGAAYLCDFGLGRDLEIATAEQMRDGAGTPMYMAPERLLRLAADEVKGDIYSLGVTIFEALTLHRPFVVPDHVGVAALAPYLASARPRRPSEVCLGFPGELEEIVRKAMAPEPGHRFDSAREIASELERYGLRSTFRSRRTPAKAPHWSHPGRPPDDSTGGDPHDLTPRPAAFTPHMIKLAALPISDSEPDLGFQAG